MNDKEEPELRLSPAAEEARAKLVEIFSDSSLASKARFRCSTEGPDEFDVLFESIIDDQFGYDPNSEYKQWVQRLYRLGLISTIPSAAQMGLDEAEIRPAIKYAKAQGWLEVTKMGGSIKDWLSITPAGKAAVES